MRGIYVFLIVIAITTFSNPSYSANGSACEEEKECAASSSQTQETDNLLYAGLMHLFMKEQDEAKRLLSQAAAKGSAKARFFQQLDPSFYAPNKPDHPWYSGPEKVVIIGGGLSGILSALLLSQLRTLNSNSPLFEISLLEEQSHLLNGASVHPARLHCGGEYPSDESTALACLQGAILFRQLFPNVYTDEDFPQELFLISNKEELGFQEHCVAQYKKIQEKYAAYFETLKETYGADTATRFFGDPISFFRIVDREELKKHGFDSFDLGLLTQEKGLNPSRLGALLETLLEKQPNVKIHRNYKAQKIYKTQYDCYQVTAGDPSQVFNAHFVVNATWHNIHELPVENSSSAVSASSTKVYFRGLGIMDTSTCSVPQFDEKNTSVFGLLGPNGGMVSLMDKTAIIYVPDDQGSYLGDDTVSSLRHSLRGHHKHKTLDETAKKRRLNWMAGNLSEKYPFLKDAHPLQLLVRSTISSSSEPLESRKHADVTIEDRVSGDDQDGNPYDVGCAVNAISTKATFAPLTALQVLKHVTAASQNARQEREMAETRLSQVDAEAFRDSELDFEDGETELDVLKKATRSYLGIAQQELDPLDTFLEVIQKINKTGIENIDKKIEEFHVLVLQNEPQGKIISQITAEIIGYGLTKHYEQIIGFWEWIQRIPLTAAEKWDGNLVLPSLFRFAQPYSNVEQSPKAIHYLLERGLPLQLADPSLADKTLEEQIAFILQSGAITTLNLAGRLRDRDHLVSLVKTLKNNQSITELTISNNQIRNEDILILIGSLPSSLKIFDLSSNLFGDEAVKALATHFGQGFYPHLHTLLAHHNDFSTDVLEKFARAINKSALTFLDMGACRLNREKLQFFLAVLQNNPTLTHLCIADNGIDDGDIPILSDFVSHNQILKTLDLRGNKITASGLYAFLTSGLLGNKTIDHIDLFDNKISELLCDSVHSLLNNSNWRDAKNNKLAYKGRLIDDIFLSKLASYTDLESLDLSGCLFSAIGGFSNFSIFQNLTAFKFVAEDNFFREGKGLDRQLGRAGGIILLKSLPLSLIELDISGHRIGSDNVALLDKFKKLEKLNLTGNNIKSRAILFLAKLTNLVALDLSNNPLTERTKTSSGYIISQDSQDSSAPPEEEIKANFSMLTSLVNLKSITFMNLEEQWEEILKETLPQTCGIYNVWES